MLNGHPDWEVEKGEIERQRKGKERMISNGMKRKGQIGRNWNGKEMKGKMSVRL